MNTKRHDLINDRHYVPLMKTYGNVKSALGKPRHAKDVESSLRGILLIAFSQLAGFRTAISGSHAILGPPLPVIPALTCAAGGSNTRVAFDGNWNRWVPSLWFSGVGIVAAKTKDIRPWRMIRHDLKAILTNVMKSIFFLGGGTKRLFLYVPRPRKILLE